MCTGSLPGNAAATRVAALVVAVMNFSFSLIRRVRRWGPAMTRSMASSSAWLVIIFWLLRAVSSAASLSTLARSAPLKPGVRRATDIRLTSCASGFAARVHLQDALAADQVGASTWIWRSKRPGRSRAGSSTSGRLVAAMRMTPADVEAVHLDQQLVEGLLALVVAAAHAGATVAADGVDLVDEDDRRGVLLGLLEQVADAAGADADEHLDEVGAGDGRRTAPRPRRRPRGQQRLAGAGLAVEQHALGILAPTAWNLAGSWRNSLISWSSSTASSAPATSANVVFGMSLVMSFARTWRTA